MILRRILIQSNKTLSDLHYVTQIVMGWTDYHLNEFIIHGKRYTIPNQIGMSSTVGHYGNEIKLSDLKFRLKRKFLYQYDFTAGWEFEIRLEKILSIDKKKIYPICISGSGASPEEECGGPHYFNEQKSINVSHFYFKDLFEGWFDAVGGITILSIIVNRVYLQSKRASDFTVVRWWMLMNLGA